MVDPMVILYVLYHKYSSASTIICITTILGSNNDMDFRRASTS